MNGKELENISVMCTCRNEENKNIENLSKFDN